MTEFKDFRLEDLFKIEKIRGFNKNELLTNPNGKYDYITRTSLNNGVESITDEVPNRSLNPPNTFSLGLLQMTFFYRERPWYAGQFVRKIVPKFKANRLIMLYMLTWLRSFSPKLLSVLVRDVDKTFNDLSIKLPVVAKTNQIDWKYIENQMEVFEHNRMEILANYLTFTGSDNYQLTEKDKQILSYKPTYASFKMEDIFSPPQKGDVDLQQRDVNGKGEYLINSGETNLGIKGRTDRPAKVFPANTITIDFWGNAYYRDFKYKLATHNHVFSFADPIIKNKEVGLYLVSILQFLKKRYSYINMLTWNKLKQVTINLPVKPGSREIDFDYIEEYIKAIQKITIKDVVKYKDKVINKKADIV